eukprot:CAMPEP_0206269576 /NCGR_PEP_ID=MMETSP0047_2-20121206/32376_1 /ASSEMBLY_ACC=CAM_ASM_000192 /TAXON_ID=195065 /ORGANISM="Chroomonas mesostigmatica_cf, Strain CCMP1168" /LENGTH=46 /DNA_ID= /DNA_START= /DNA_END= /DNA_ORIENTATION=
MDLGLRLHQDADGQIVISGLRPGAPAAHGGHVAPGDVLLKIDHFQM